MVQTNKTDPGHDFPLYVIHESTSAAVHQTQIKEIKTPKCRNKFAEQIYKA